jgi:hypothetical protein
MSKRKPSENLIATLDAAEYNTRIIRSRNRILGTSDEQEGINNVGGVRLVTRDRGRIGEESRSPGGVEQDDVSLGGCGRGGGQSLRCRGSGISGGRAKIANGEQSHNFSENDVQNNNRS